MIKPWNTFRVGPSPHKGGGLFFVPHLPLQHHTMIASASALPVMIAIAEFENPLLDLYGLELAHRIAAARRRAPRFVRLAGHNHTSLIAHFNTIEDNLGREIVDFTRRLV